MNELQALSFDVETWGELPEYALQPFRALSDKASIRAASYARDGKAAGSINPSPQAINNVLSKAAEQDLYVVAWNSAFDCAWLIATGLEDLAFRLKWLDAMLLWRHWLVEPEGDDVPKQKRKSYSLENAIKEFFPGEAEFKGFTDFQATDAESLKKLLVRNKGDALFTLRLAQMFWSQLTDRQRRAALIEARCIPQVAWIYVHGIHSSRGAAEQLSEELRIEAERLEAELLAAAPEAAGVNFGSPKQLQTLLYETWGLPLSRTSKKTGDPSTDKYALFDLAPLDPRAKLLKQLREAKNNRTKYPEATLKSLDYNGDGCVRPGARIFGTYTSRMTYSGSQKAKQRFLQEFKRKPAEWREKNVELPTGIALHQWKRGKEYRQLIQAPPGYTLVELDAAGQEFRWMAVASGDETMLSLCAPGEDAHSYMGAQISEIAYRELIRLVKAEDEHAALQRKLGKFANLSFQYRVSARTATMKARVDYELEVEETFIKQILATYKQSYPGVVIYWNEQIRKCKMLGYAETFAGRRVQLIGSWMGRDAWPLESTAINYPIQGTGGDQKYLALAVARNDLAKFNGYFYFELHDGLFFIFPNDKAQAAAAHFKHKLSNLPYQQAWGFQPPITFPFDTKLGPDWGHLKEFSE